MKKKNIIDDRILNVGDKVIITSDINELNQFMTDYCGQKAEVLEILDESYNGGQICKLDIDGGMWAWSFNDKMHQIDKL